MKVCGKLIFLEKNSCIYKSFKKRFNGFLNTNSYRKIDSYVVDDMYYV